MTPEQEVQVTRSDLGHSWLKRYEPTGTVMHAVRREGDIWVAVCTGRRATREFEGSLLHQNRPCKRCLAAMTDG